MIRAKLHRAGKDLVLLGIDAENVKRLKAGKPILVKGESIGLEADIWIAYGDTLAAICKKYNLPSVH